ncbi:MAG: AMP-binding protein, partial [Bacteroidales bacterium]|nr:AMP-binding protein [Bacteroidales bacterium]
MTTIIDIFESSVSKFSNNPFLWEKKTDKYESLTYGKVREQTKILAAGLIKLNVKKEDRIALLSEGRNYWVMSELAILYTGAINVPLSVKLDAGTDLRFRLEHSGTKMIIVSNAQAHKIRQ